MKNISTILFILLFALVAILFYVEFTDKKTDLLEQARLDAANHKINVAYVDIDTLENKYEYFKMLQKKYEQKRDSIDKVLNRDYNTIENERLQFIQKGNAITEMEAQNFEAQYKLKMQNLENKKYQLSKDLNDEQTKGMDDVLTRIEAYMKEYNKNSHYSFVFGVAKGNMMFLHKDTACNITNEVLKGLNEEYQKTAKK